MKTLVPVRATKALDQQAQSYGYGQSEYVPIHELQRWTGNGVSPGTASNIITVYQCIRILSRTFATIPLLLYRRRPDGGKERAVDHPLYGTFHLQPNPEMSSYTWRELVMGHLKTWGNHYSEKWYDGFGRLQLSPIRPDRMAVKYEDGVRVYDYLDPLGGRKRMAPGSVFHVQGLSSNGLLGDSPITQMRRALTLLNAAETYGEAVFRNGARPAVVLSHPRTLSDPAIERLAKQMDDLRGAKNAGKTVVLEEGLTVTEVGFPPEDAQFMETRLFQKREISEGGFGLPWDEDGKQTEAEQSLKLIKQTMLPEFVNFEQAAQIQIIDDPDYFLEFLADGYLRGDPKARADSMAVQWEHGALSDDEWRGYENMNPLPDGLGKTYWRPANWVPLDAPAVPVGGDTSNAANPDASFGQSGELFTQTTRAKSMAQFDCPDCGKMVNRLAAPGTVGYCKGCKAEKTFEEAMAEAVA